MAGRRGSRERTLAILAAVPGAVRVKVRAAIEAEAAAIVAMQKRLVPKKRGGLARSIRYEMGAVSLASSANLAAGGGARSKGSRHSGSAGSVVGGDPDLTATIVAGDAKSFYARFVEFGTKPHVIKPRRRFGVLVFGGRALFRGQAVQHPGSAPRPFFYGPYRARKKKARRAVARAISRAIKDLPR